MPEGVYGLFTVLIEALKPRRNMTCMFFGVLGPVTVWTTAGEPIFISGTKVRALLAVLLLHEGAAVSADRLIDDLWGEDPPGNPAGTLSAKASQLRRALEQAEPGSKALVGSPPPGYSLRIDSTALDASRFRTLTTLARETEDAPKRAKLLSDALALWRGPAFADFADEPFVQSAAARLAEERLTAQEHLAETRLELGEHAELIAELAVLLATHPFREKLRAAHIRALYRAGRQHEALESFEQFRVQLADELGLDPSADLLELHQAVLRQDPSLNASPVLRRPRTNLPAAFSGLIGRDKAVSELLDRLQIDRLVTLTGTGGVGKTRLAQAVATAAVEDCEDGVWLVELAGLESTGDPADAIRTALDIRDVEGPAQSATDHLIDALRNQRPLLVLDNCEHIIDSVALLAERLLQAVPGLRILATSREPLGLFGEVVWSVPPLEVPASDLTDPAAMKSFSAVQLFVARASAASTTFTLDADSAAAVAVLCRRLDGIPLALELAATRVRALGVHGLVARLDDRFRLLATGYRGTPPRQQTLMAMIDWSWDLLTEPERVVLRRLAVQHDGCTVEAAESLCTVDSRSELGESTVVDLLVRLVDKSLLTVTHSADGPRYRLLESVAAYCLDRLVEAGELEQVQEHYGRYYTALAERAQRHLYGHDQRKWLLRLDHETANLRSALGNAVRAGAAERALRLVNALGWYWFLRGRLAEARRWLEEALAIDGAAPANLKAAAKVWLAGFALRQGESPETSSLCEQVDDPLERARCEWFLAYIEADLGNIIAVENRLERALVTFRACGDTWGTAAVLAVRAKLAHVRGDVTVLERDGEESAKLFKSLGDRWGQLQATAWLGGRAEMMADYDRAIRLHREGLRLAEELGLWPDVSVRLAWLGWIAFQQCEYKQAYDLCSQALQIATEQGFRVGEIFAEIGLGFILRRQGDLDMAETRLLGLLDSAEAQQQEQAPPLFLPMVLDELGFIAEQRGQAIEAKKMHLAAFEAAHTLGQSRSMAQALEGLAGAAQLAGDHVVAAQLLGAANAARTAIATPLAPAERIEVDRITTSVQTALGEAFDANYQHSTGLTLAQARALIS